jgi:hypothetical protein
VVKDLNLDWPMHKVGQVLGGAPGDVQKEKRDVLRGEGAWAVVGCGSVGYGVGWRVVCGVEGAGGWQLTSALLGTSFGGLV